MAVLDIQAFKRQQRKMFSKGAEKGAISIPLLGLPIRRVIPIDVHSLLDYAGGSALIASGLASGDSVAAACGTALGSAAGSVSLLTDYRLSLKKWIPIEIHEVIDYVYGASAILAPFVFGYSKKARFATFTHIMVGVTTILGSLFTDYRGQKGVHWSDSPTLPKPV